jgi:tRNA(Ile)-lysidine synthase
LPKGASLLVAVSGGQDSVCLLQLLVWWQKRWGWRLVVAHCDHRWRTDSHDNALFVQNLAHQWQLPFGLAVADSPLPNEASARQWRYQQLHRLAIEQGCRIMVTGHTMNDRAETFLYNLLRGCGTDGLGSLTWQRNLQYPDLPAVSLVRPLLHISRQETGEFCRHLQLPVFWDSTNDDWQYARNRLRQELIPYLEQHFNPQVIKHLAQTGELLHIDMAYLEAQAQQFWQTQDINQPALDRAVLGGYHPALQKRIVRQFLQHHLSAPVDYAQVHKFCHLLTAPNGSQTDPFPSAVVAIVKGNYIYLQSISKP